MRESAVIDLQQLAKQLCDDAQGPTKGNRLICFILIDADSLNILRSVVLWAHDRPYTTPGLDWLA